MFRGGDSPITSLTYGAKLTVNLKAKIFEFRLFKQAFVYFLLWTRNTSENMISQKYFDPLLIKLDLSKRDFHTGLK